MRFEPKTEKEVAEAGLLPRGDYDFEVLDAEETQSKKGNDMLSLSLRVYDAEGNGRRVYDYLVHTDFGAYKVRHFAYAAGLGGEYESGELQASQMIGATGKCRVIIQKDRGGQYPDKNAVADYLLASSAGNGVQAPLARDPRPEPPPLDDEIPF